MELETILTMGGVALTIPLITNLGSAYWFSRNGDYHLSPREGYESIIESAMSDIKQSVPPLRAIEMPAYNIFLRPGMYITSRFGNTRE